MSLHTSGDNPYAQWANGTVEHFGKILRKFLVMGTNWKTESQHFLRTITGFLSSYLLFNGRTYNSIFSIPLNQTNSSQHDAMKLNDESTK